MNQHFDSVTDSGQRRDFGTGSVRDQAEGKGRYDLLEPYAIKRLAQHFENGAKKYGDNNWKLGQPLSVYLDSGIRHGFNLLEGQTNEDHAAAMAWNAMAFISTKHWIDEGKLPKELDDIDWDVAPEEAKTLLSSWDGVLNVEIKDISADMLKVFYGEPVNFFESTPGNQAGPTHDELLVELIDLAVELYLDEYTPEEVDELLEAQHPEHQAAWIKQDMRVGVRRLVKAINRRQAKPAPQSGDRVSVRQILRAVDGAEIPFAEPVFDEDGVEVSASLNTESRKTIVNILDKLEDAGFQITKA